MTEAIVKVAVKRLPHAEGLPLPAYHSPGAVGLDLFAALPSDTKVVLEPGSRYLVQTGIALALPQDYEAQVRPRSGLARDYGVTVLNAPGTVDPDYRGEILVPLINHGDVPFEVVRGARIAQLVVAPVTRVALFEASELNSTARAADGFGSTGRFGGEAEAQ
jgi:dUTP pyrophosphatase